MKKKVCMIVPNPLVMGGIASVVNGYRHSKLEEDYEVTYLESYRDGTKLQKTTKALKSYLKFAKLLCLSRPDLVHIHSSFGPSFYRKLPFIQLSSLFGIPIVNHIHGAEFDTFYKLAGERKQKSVRKAYSACACLVALSEEWKEKLSEIVSSKKVTVLENYSVLQERIDRSKEAKQVLFLGEIGQRKGCFDLPEIIHLVMDKVPDARFVIAGNGELSFLKEQLKERGLESVVQFPGWVRGEQKDQLLRESAIFLLPSYHEGMPMSILDAMGYGLPIVSTEVGGIPKLVVNGQNGYLRKPGDKEGIAEALIWLLEEPDKRLAAGEKSREIVKQRYTLEAHLEQLEALYENVLNEADHK